MADKADKPQVMTEQNVAVGSWRECQTDFNLSRHLIPLLQDQPFWSSISRHIKKRMTYDIPTAAVAYDIKADELVMWVNPVFAVGGTYNDASGTKITREPLSNWQIRGTLIHEFSHPVFGHLSSRRMDPPQTANIACDLAINSIIVSSAGQPRDVEPGKTASPLPQGAVIPGEMPYIDPVLFAKLKPEDQAATIRRCKLIESFPKMMASEWYFRKLLEDAKANGDGEGTEYCIGPMDNHDGWDGVPDDMREYVEGKIKSILEKAVKQADSHADGWGNIPAELQAEIRRSVSNIVNWRAVLRQFVGGLVRGARATSIRRINRKYPYIHPGIKRGYTAKLFVAVDESGSVGDDMLELFFAELDGLTRKIDITLCHFDCDAGPKDLYEWKKGMRPKLNRVRGGGTDFSAPTAIVNDPRNRGRWDGMLICTDGGAGKPIPCRIKRAWVLGQNCKLMFESDETQIFLSPNQPMKGAWR